MNRRSPVAVAAVLSAALVLSACGGGDATEAANAPAAPAAEAGGPLDLAAAGCPATVVMQQDWQPEAEHGAMYSVVGSDYTIDADAKAVKGSFVAQGVDTGVDIEVRPGGPNTGFQPVPALMYLDETITIGAVNTEDAINGADDQPTVAVTSQLTKSPQIMMWDPASHPGLSTLKEVAATGVPFVTSGELLPGLAVAAGLIQPSQIDTTYQGSPARFVGDPTIIQQGFATSEPYTYENEIEQWRKPIAVGSMYDYGYISYPEPLAVRADKLEGLRPCLEKLVPIMQQAQIDYLAEPGPTNRLIVELVETYQTSWTYSEGVAEFSAREQVAGGFVFDDPASGVFGQFDPARMQQIVDTMGPILQQQGGITELPAPTELYTNEFIDPSIKMGG